MGLIRLFSFLALCLLFSGCGGEMAKSSIQSSQASAESAMELEKDGKYAEALPLVDNAIKGGGLNPDQLCEAYLLRARCYSHDGKLAEAEQDIATAEQGSPNPASWHYTRAILFNKQNKSAESKSEFAKAVKIDAKLKMPK